MKCQSCGFDNPTGYAFSEEYGSSIQPACPACSSEIRPIAKFCRSCGGDPWGGGAEILARQPMGPVLASPETRDLMVRLLREGVAVAQGMGIDLPPELPDKLIEIASNHVPPNHRTSMFEGLLGGKRLEVEALSGTLVRQGSEHGVETPLHFAVYAALNPFVNRGVANL